MTLRPDEDAFGHLLADHLAGEDVVEIVERDDGSLFTGDPSWYFAPLRRWWPQERRAMRFVRGRVLDLGCGAGRVALHLQARGLDVVALDHSPLAVEVARRRGVRDARVGTLDDVEGERFDTVLMLGNGVGLLRGEAEGRRMLERLAGMTGRVLAGSFDPYAGASERKRALQAANRARGRMGGVETIRLRYLHHATPWFDVLFASRDELTALAAAPAGRSGASSTRDPATSRC